MKIHWTFTYVVNKMQPNGAVESEIVPYAEWRALAMSNKGLPKEKRRWFIRLYDLQGKEMNCMFVEAPYDYYLAWHREHEAYMCNRKAEKAYQFVSMDAQPFDDSSKSYAQLFGTPHDAVERSAISNVSVWDAVDDTHPWNADVLVAYVNGEKRHCTKPLAQKYGVSEQMFRKYKRHFERRIVENLLDNV